MSRDTTKADFFWPLAAVAAVAMAILITMVFVLVSQFDAAARRREQVVVENGARERTAEVAHMLVPQVMWDDAVRHLDNRFDVAWARENIGQYLGQVDGFEGSFVLDTQDRLIFAADRHDQTTAASYAPFAHDGALLAGRLRELELKRGPLRKPARPGTLVATPVQATTLSMSGGRLYVLTATLVQPDFGGALPLGPRAPIVLAAMPIDGAFLRNFARRYMLDGVHLDHSDTAHEPHEAHAILRDISGANIATLDWSPRDPGEALFRELVLPILIVVAGLAVCALVLYRRGRRMAQGLVASEARATHLAHHDVLTGLPNRVLMFDRLGFALDHMRRTGRPLVAHALDLDRFKEVNDTYGHHVGDELIREAAQRLANICRSEDTFSRLSGDEFAAIQLDAGPQAAAALAERFIAAMAEPFDLSAGRVHVGCSIGIVTIVDPDIEPVEILRQADLALYRAKDAGKHQYCFFEPDMDVAVKNRRMLEDDLREALALGSLEMAYQPQVNKRGMMTGVEALVRWNHPVRGAVSPAFFVKVAEECGLINQLGLFTLRRAFEDSARWPGLKVAVNVSAAQLRLKDFLQNLKSLVRELSVDPSRFELEITEGLLLGDDPLTHDSLASLRQMGFSLALDDFGTGYSSLSYLQRYPITKIKIDRSFITNLGIDAEADAVVGAIVKLARALNLAVIAEGVETIDQRQRLAAAGCSEIQGYLFSRPVPADAIDLMNRSRHLDAPLAA